MFHRLLFSFLIVLICSSCKKNASEKNNLSQELDTIIDFTKEDVSPYFKVCEKLLDDSKTNCFRTHIQKHFSEKLEELALASKESIDETITVVLIVDKKGAVSLKELVLSDVIKTSFPDLKINIGEMVKSLPNLYPALKRGIPVNTEYKLPINIKVE